jgi:sugar phosphate isomerase/epimerase
VILGCNTVLFGGTDLSTGLQHIAWAGYRGAEVAAIKGMCEHVTPGNGEGYARDVKKMGADLGLTFTAMEASTTDAERLKSLCELAHQLDIPIVAIGSGGESGNEESLKQVIALIAELAEVAQNAGVRLACKPHVGAAVYNTETALRLVREVTNPALGLNFDPSHIYRADEDPQDVASAWGTHIITSHFRDCASRARPVGAPETQVPGRGAIDIPATLRALKGTGYDGPINLEVIGAVKHEVSRAMGIAAESRGYLHRVLQEIDWS